VSEREDAKDIDAARGERPEDAPVRKPWETPVIEELAVQLSALLPIRGADGGLLDCSRS
jgi:hypothetical protein